jgi:hypothetical protein
VGGDLTIAAGDTPAGQCREAKQANKTHGRTPLSEKQQCNRCTGFEISRTPERAAGFLSGGVSVLRGALNIYTYRRVS